jgi:hypothetical protein
MPEELTTQKWTFDDLREKLLSIMGEKLLSIMGDIDHCIETDWHDVYEKENEIFILSGWTRKEYEEEDEKQFLLEPLKHFLRYSDTLEQARAVFDSNKEQEERLNFVDPEEENRNLNDYVLLLSY